MTDSPATCKVAFLLRAIPHSFFASHQYVPASLSRREFTTCRRWRRKLREGCGERSVQRYRKENVENKNQQQHVENETMFGLVWYWCWADERLMGNTRAIVVGCRSFRRANVRPFTKLHQASSGKRCGASFYEGGKTMRTGIWDLALVICVQGKCLRVCRCRGVSADMRLTRKRYTYGGGGVGVGV